MFFKVELLPVQSPLLRLVPSIPETLQRFRESFFLKRQLDSERIRYLLEWLILTPPSIWVLEQSCILHLVVRILRLDIVLRHAATVVRSRMRMPTVSVSESPANMLNSHTLIVTAAAAAQSYSCTYMCGITF